MRGPRRTSTSGGLSNLLPGDALPGRRLDERGEEPGAPRDAPPHALRMPLYAHGKGPPRDFYRLDRPAPLALHRPGHDREPGSRAVDDLMVKRVHPEPAVAEDLREPAAGGDHHLVHRRVLGRFRRGLALIVAAGPEAEEGDVLVERPAGRDVQHLDAAADAEDGEGAPGRLPGQRNPQGIPRMIDLDPASFPEPLAVERRIDVLAPRQHEAVEAVERDLPGVLGARKQRHHLASGRLNRVQVILQLGGATPGDPDPRAIARTGSAL